jgi:hypothetical protein
VLPRGLSTRSSSRNSIVTMAMVTKWEMDGYHNRNSPMKLLQFLIHGITAVFLVSFSAHKNILENYVIYKRGRSKGGFF